VANQDYAALERDATTLASQRKFAEAERLSAAALEQRANRYGVNSPEYAEGLVIQGNLRRSAGQLKLAEESYAQALAIQQTTGKYPAETDTLTRLAATARSGQQFEQAASLYERALALQPSAEERGRILTALGGLA